MKSLLIVCTLNQTFRVVTGINPELRVSKKHDYVIAEREDDRTRQNGQKMLNALIALSVTDIPELIMANNNRMGDSEEIDWDAYNGALLYLLDDEAEIEFENFN